MSETPAPYTADPPPDGPEPLAPGAPLPYTARLDSATLHAWVTAAMALLQELLTASQIPADWPREQAWQPTVQLYPTYRERITALLAGNLPPDPLVAEVNRLCGLLTEAHAERDALKTQLADAPALPDLPPTPPTLAGRFWVEEDDHAWQLLCVPTPTAHGLQILKAPKTGTRQAAYWPAPEESAWLVAALNAVPGLAARLGPLQAERDAWHAQAVTSADLLESSTDAHEALSAEVARLQAERDRWREQIAALATERLSAERIANVPDVAKGQR